MIIKIYQVDAFTDRLFSGNPAAVCITETHLSEELMQSIAFEKNLAETSFVVPAGKDFEIRWFTPKAEVDLCGHATLASAFVIFNLLNYPGPVIRFHSRVNGLLSVEKEGDMLFLDFPTDKLEMSAHEQINVIEKCIGIRPLELYKGKSDYLAVIDSQRSLKALVPDLKRISELDSRGLIVTSKGDHVDFVSRFFAPQLGVNEDPVTGSAHTSLIPFWSKKLFKDRMIANQLSERGGQLVCEFRDNRCRIGGKGRLFLTGEINLE